MLCSLEWFQEKCDDCVCEDLVSLRLLRLRVNRTEQRPSSGVSSFSDGSKGKGLTSLYLSMHQQADCQGHIQATFRDLGLHLSPKMWLGVMA